MDASTGYVASRTCSAVGEGGQERTEGKSTPMARLADSAAYVLIAEPGAGKTTAFKAEAAREGAAYATVRDFRTFDDKPEWHGTTLFLDGRARGGTRHAHGGGGPQARRPDARPGFLPARTLPGHDTTDREAFWIGELEKVYGAWSDDGEVDA